MLPFQGIHSLLRSRQTASVLCCSVALHFLVFQCRLLLLNSPLCLHLMANRLEQVTSNGQLLCSGLHHARAEVRHFVASWPMCSKSA